MKVAFPTAILSVALWTVVPDYSLAHGARAQPSNWWRAWNWDPLILLTVTIIAAVYGRGLAKLWQHTGAGRKVCRWQAAALLAAILFLALALISPLDALSEELSSAHMAQHMLLMNVAAPLFVLGSPTLVLAWGVVEIWKGGNRGSAPLRWAFRLPNLALTWHPLLLWTGLAIVLWGWHHPVLYHAALRDPLVHDVQHLSFFIVACFYWRLLVAPLGERRLSGPAAVLYLFTTSLHTSLLGLYLALSSRLWYDDYAVRTSVWGLTPIEDQQLAGLIMWMPACLVYPAVAAILLGVWLNRLALARRSPSFRALEG